MKETLYIILNEHMPNVFKCGITKYDGPHRAKTLCTTGVPGKMEVYREIRILNNKKVEDISVVILLQFKEKLPGFLKLLLK